MIIMNKNFYLKPNLTRLANIRDITLNDFAWTSSVGMGHSEHDDDWGRSRRHR